MDNGYDYLLKCLIIGDSGIGKSSMMYRFTDDKYNPSYISTIGVDFNVKTIKFNTKIFKFQIWDTAGQERFRTITSSYYRGADAIIICYDITEKETFNNVTKWLNEIKRFSNNNPLLILCGTKSDMDNKREISIPEGNIFALENNMKFIETSSKNNEGVQKLFETIANNKLDNIFNNTYDIYDVNDMRKKININKQIDDKNSKKKCC